MDLSHQPVDANVQFKFVDSKVDTLRGSREV